MLVLFGLGSLFIRSVGCLINDIFDRDIDAKVTIKLVYFLWVLVAGNDEQDLINVINCQSISRIQWTQDSEASIFWPNSFYYHILKVERTKL